MAPRPHLLAALLILLAVGCGDGPESQETSGESGDPVLVAALGDSITAGSPLWDPDPAIRAQLGTEADERSRFEYWVSRGDPRIEFRNCGVFGERTDQIALRLDSCAEGADALLIQGGINDIAQGRPLAEVAADLRSMVVAGRELGLPVTLVDVLPWNNGHPAADAPIAELNAEIVRIGSEEGVPVLPFHETLEDPGEPGLMRAEWTVDGDHPSIAGYRRLAERAFGELALP